VWKVGESGDTGCGASGCGKLNQQVSFPHTFRRIVCRKFMHFPLHDFLPNTVFSNVKFPFKRGSRKTRPTFPRTRHNFSKSLESPFFRISIRKISFIQQIHVPYYYYYSNNILFFLSIEIPLPEMNSNPMNVQKNKSHKLHIKRDAYFLFFSLTQYLCCAIMILQTICSGALLPETDIKRSEILKP